MNAIIFSDIDGTLVHYIDETPEVTCSREPDERGVFTLELKEKGAVRALPLPVSSTGLKGWVPESIFEDIAQLRRTGVPFVLISGARTTTVLARAPHLPAADAVVTENGGRVFVAASGAFDCEATPGCSGSLAPPGLLQEDLEWRKRHEGVAGPQSADSEPADQRQGLLWDTYRSFQQQGFAVDARDYSTCFRAATGTSTAEALTAAQLHLPAGLRCTYNLGKLDVYPATSGKAAAALYLAAKRHAHAQDCIFLCDDDNDIELATTVGHAYLPNISTASVTAAVAADPAHFTVATNLGVLGTGEVLRKLMDDLRLRSSGSLRTAGSVQVAAAPV